MNQLYDALEDRSSRVRTAHVSRSSNLHAAHAVLRPRRRTFLFAGLLCVVIFAGLVRSWVATSLDSLQIDEAWHTVAGISYVRTGDFRLNAEHPPLIKLWVGATMPARYVLRPFRALDDKIDERKMVDETHSLDNNPEWAQRHMRLSMCAFNAVLLIALGFALRRAVGSVVALIAIAWLMIDPTVAAHLPLVLTDLPVALLATITVLQALFAFRSWRARDLLLASLALGCTLAAKHSALVLGLAAALLALLCAFAPKLRGDSTLSARARLTRIAAVFAGAYLILWSSYGFRFDERGSASTVQLSAASQSGTFNRPIETKIRELSRPSARAAIQLALDWHLLPRAYLWGLADIARVLEGRDDTYVFGTLFRGTTPWYFFPLTVSTKLPLGLLGFALAGAVILARRRGLTLPIAVILGWSSLHMFLLMRGNSGYAGVRHALPVYPAIALLAAVPVTNAFAGKARAAQSVVTAGVVATLALVLPVMRPWEYFNELVGGADNAWQSFNNEGVDSGQRVGELIRYYNDHLRGTNEPVYDFYGLSEPDTKLYKLDFTKLGSNPDDASQILEGTVFVSTTSLAPLPIYDYRAFRQAPPLARIGNLLVLRGKFDIPWLPADRKSTAAFEALEKAPPDKVLAEKLLSEVAMLYPQDFQSTLELANLLLERGDRQAALNAYELSRKHARGNSQITFDLLTQQIDLLQHGQSPHTVRPPWLE